MGRNIDRLDFFQEVVNTQGRVRLELVNGKELEGMLCGDDRFNLLVEKAEGETIILPKHSVISAKIL